MINLWFSPSKKRYYCSDEIKCTNCHENIENYMIFTIFWDKKESWASYYCSQCYAKIEGKRPLVAEYKLVVLEKPPKDSIPYIIRKPQVIKSNEISIFDVKGIERKYDSHVTKDNTIYIDYPSIKGAKIGRMVASDKKIKQKDILVYIDSLKAEGAENEH